MSKCFISQIKKTSVISTKPPTQTGENSQGDRLMKIKGTRGNRSTINDTRYVTYCD